MHFLRSPPSPCDDDDRSLTAICYNIANRPMSRPISDVISLLRALLGTLSTPGTCLFIVVFAIKVIPRFPDIESKLATEDPSWWLQLAEPTLWATSTVAAWTLGVPITNRLRSSLSPTYRFRQLATEAELLAAALSGGRDHAPFIVVGRALPSPSPTPQLKTRIAAFAVSLNALGIQYLPPICDVDAWAALVPRLRACMGGGHAGLARARETRWHAHD